MSLPLPPHLASLFENARTGSADALGALFEEFRPYLYVLARQAQRRRLRAKYGDSDLLQDTFTAAYEEFEQFRGRSPEELLAWLECILHRLSLNRINAFKQHNRDLGRERPLDGPRVRQPRHDALDAHGESPCDLAIRAEMCQLAWQALLRLPEKYRQVIELRFRHGESFESIAGRLGLTESTIRKRCERGLALWHRAASELQHKSDLV